MVQDLNQAINGAVYSQFIICKNDKFSQFMKE